LGWGPAGRNFHCAALEAAVPRRRPPSGADAPVPAPPQALTALGCMEHRGACSADDDSGDGAGLMTQIPWKLLKKEMPQLNETTMG
jgi:hypothetical protein